MKDSGAGTNKLNVAGGIKMGNIVPRAGLEPTSLAFWVSALPLHHIGSLTSPQYPRPPGYAAPCFRSVQTTTLNCNQTNLAWHCCDIKQMFWMGPIFMLQR